MIDTTIDLREFDQAFASQTEPAEIADGNYTARIIDVSLTKSKAGNPMIVWDLRITGPQFEGRILRKRRAITEKSMQWVRRDLEVCGLALTRLSELASQLHRVIDLDLEISKATRNGDTDLYMNRRIEPGGNRPESEDEDLPF